MEEAKTMLLLASLALVCATPVQAQIQFPDDPPSPPLAENVCPLPYEAARSYVEWHLTNPEVSNLRELAGTAGISPEDVRPLNSVLFEGDDAVCGQLHEKYSGEFVNAPDAKFEAAYFKAGNRYFALFRLVPPEDMIVSGITEFMFVLDNNLGKIEAFGH